MLHLLEGAGSVPTFNKKQFNSKSSLSSTLPEMVIVFILIKKYVLKQISMNIMGLFLMPQRHIIF